MIYLKLVLVLPAAADVGLSSLLKSMLFRPALDKGLGKVFGRILGETWFCSCLVLDMRFQKKQNRRKENREKNIWKILVLQMNWYSKP